MAKNKKKREKEEKLKISPKAKVREIEFLTEIKPREAYSFHSDYFTIDDSYATIMSFFHNEAAVDNYGPFWGVNKIPSGLKDGVTVHIFEQVRRQSDRWLQEHQTKAEGVAETNISAQQRGGNATAKGKARRRREDFQMIAAELQNGASYVQVHFRILVKAKTLEDLDEAVEQLDRLYIDRFATLRAAAYHGSQKPELNSLFLTNNKKEGKGFYFTSTEFAGAYDLVTHGVEDAGGEYVGYMMGDVNNSAVLFDVDKYRHHIVVANESYHEGLGRQYISDMWGSKFSQACMINNGRVVHFILDGCKLDKLGPAFADITTFVDLNKGDVNMFEMFGTKDEELSIFPSQMEKLILMAEQAYTTTDQDRSIIRGSLEELATKFYVDQGMWRDDAKEHRERLRVVGIPHNEVPKLDIFVSYLETAHKAALTSDIHDPEREHALGVLKLTFRNLLRNNGDLFNTITSDAIDSIYQSNRVIYDFSSLMRRGKGVAMAQFVNVIAFAVNNLGKNDTVIIHGCEHIDDGIKPYINQRFAYMFEKGARVCYLYNKIDNMLDDKKFCVYDKADYLIFGNMTESQVRLYQDRMRQEIPADLGKLVTTKGENVCYIRRGVDNVVFKQDLALGIKSKRVR